MSEEILKRVMDLFDKAQNMIYEVQRLQGSVDSSLERLEQLQKGFDGAEVQRMITNTIRMNLTHDEVGEIAKLVAEESIRMAKERLERDDWRLLNKVEECIQDETQETINRLLREDEVKVQLRSIVETNLNDAVDEALKEIAKTIPDVAINTVVEEHLKEKVEELPDIILRRFGYKVGDC